MEQRHREVADRRRGELLVVAQRAPVHGEPALRDDRGLRRARRPRREDEEHGRVGGRPAASGNDGGAMRSRHSSRYSSVSTTRTRSRVDAEVEAVEQREELPLGHDELAVGVADVGGELGAAPRRVDAHHRGPRHRARAEPEAQLGHVLEEEADVERPRPAQRQRERGARRRRGGVLVPRPPFVLEQQRRVRVAVPAADHLVDGLLGHCNSPAGPSTRRSGYGPRHRWFRLRRRRAGTTGVTPFGDGQTTTGGASELSGARCSPGRAWRYRPAGGSGSW